MYSFIKEEACSFYLDSDIFFRPKKGINHQVQSAVNSQKTGNTKTRKQRRIKKCFILTGNNAYFSS